MSQPIWLYTFLRLLMTRTVNFTNAVTASMGEHLFCSLIRPINRSYSCLCNNMHCFVINRNKLLNNNKCIHHNNITLVIVILVHLFGKQIIFYLSSVIRQMGSFSRSAVISKVKHNIFILMSKRILIVTLRAKDIPHFYYFLWWIFFHLQFIYYFIILYSEHGFKKISWYIVKSFL